MFSMQTYKETTITFFLFNKRFVDFYLIIESELDLFRLLLKKSWSLQIKIFTKNRLMNNSMTRYTAYAWATRWKQVSCLLYGKLWNTNLEKMQNMRWTDIVRDKMVLRKIGRERQLLKCIKKAKRGKTFVKNRLCGEHNTRGEMKDDNYWWYQIRRE